MFVPGSTVFTNVLPHLFSLSCPLLFLEVQHSHCFTHVSVNKEREVEEILDSLDCSCCCFDTTTLPQRTAARRRGRCGGRRKPKTALCHLPLQNRHLLSLSLSRESEKDIATFLHTLASHQAHFCFHHDQPKAVSDFFDCGMLCRLVGSVLDPAASFICCFVFALVRYLYGQ